MDRLAEQVVIWHNRHPLAKRITIYDVHTIGVVALPFMRSGPAAGPASPARGADPRGPIEPVLTDEISPESLAAAWDDESTVAANTNAAHLDALADQEAIPAAAQTKGAKAWLERLAFWRRTSGGTGAHGAQIWPAFSERFVAGLSPKTVARFAEKQAYATQPGDASWPLRIIAMDDQLMSRGGASSGAAWPFELYLMSAAIDAGRSRSRVLVGRGGQQAQILGRRCYSPARLAVVALMLLSLLGMGTAVMIPGLIVKKSSSAVPEPAASAAASAAAPLASAASAGRLASAASAPASASLPASTTASAEEPLASAPASTAAAASESARAPLPITPPALDLAASAAAQREAIAAAEEAKAKKAAEAKARADEADAEAGIDKNAPRPDIRPLIVKPIPGRSAPPLRSPGAPANSKEEESSKAEANKSQDKAQDKADAAASKPADKAKSGGASPDKLGDKSSGKGAASGSSSGRDPGRDSKEPADKNPAMGHSVSGATKLEGPAAARVASMAKKPVVALVGPVSASKAEAEATLERMRSLLAPVHTSSSPLQAQVFQTPEGYRPAVWPFASREEAQLINATLVARGMRTRAVDF